MGILNRTGDNMKYADFVKRLSEETHLDKDVVRVLLDKLPDVLMEMSVGEKVRTPLGTFFCEERPPKKVQLPSGEWSQAKKLRRVRIRPSSRMQEEIK